MAITYAAREAKKNKKSNRRAVRLLICAGSVLLLLLVLFSVTKGSSSIPLQTVWDSVFHFDAEKLQHLVVRDLRLPRVIASALVGAALAVAGAVMQGVTGNPMADSGLMGLNAGASFALSLSLALIPRLTYMETVLLCFAGAALGAVIVNIAAHAGRRDPSPMRLVLAGAAVSALLTALSQGIALCFDVSQDMMFWTLGGVSASNWNQTAIMTPIVITALAFAFIMSGQVSLVSLGEEVAKGLGVNTGAVRLLSSAIVVVLAGVSVSIVGAVGFLGLIVPHIVRYFVGVDYRHIIPCSAVFGALFMVMADLGAKTLNPPAETPIGAIISLVGVPFFLYLARRQRRA